MTVPRPIPFAVGLAALLAACGGDAQGSAPDPNLFTVARGDLPIVVKENAELQALRETIVRSEVEGQSTIIYIVPEGTIVKQGDRLVELDVSELMEKEDNQEISVGKAKNALDQARIQQGILEKELTTKRNTAQSMLRIATMELEKLLGAPSAKAAEGKNGDMVHRLRELVAEPKAAAVQADAAVDAPADASAPVGGPAAPLIGQVNPRAYAGLVDRVVRLLDKEDGTDPLERDMGEMANKILLQTDQIKLAMADLKTKEDTVTHSRRLAAKKFITGQELARDELAYQSQASKVMIAWNDLELLINYTLEKDKIKLKQDDENARLELDRVEASNEAERQKSTTDVEAKDKEYIVAKERLDNLQRQIKSGVILAPTPGTVVYARLDRNRGGGEAVREGVQVRERQELIILPDTTKMRCIIKVQEAQVNKVRAGQIADVVVEAFQGETFNGRVTSVAPVADSNSGWMTSDRKVYTTVVELDSDNPDGRLRSRMAANVTIRVDIVKDTLPVPLQAVFRDRSVNYVWKVGSDGPIPTKVKVGRQNSERVEVLDGIAAGDVVTLTTPPGKQLPTFEQPVLPDPPPMKEAAKPAGDVPAPAGSVGDGAPVPAGDGAQRGPRSMGPNNKKLVEMTPEELDGYKTRISGDFMQRMIDGARQNGNLDAASEAEAAIAGLRQALEKNDLVAGQVHQDKLRSVMRRMGGRQGGPGGGNGPGGNGPGGNAPGGNGEGGDRPRRGGGDGGGERSGGRGNRGGGD